MWTRLKWKFGWRNNLMDEELQGFGLVESAKRRDGWSSWSFEGVAILQLFLFLCYFVVCRWWTLFFFFYDFDDTLTLIDLVSCILLDMMIYGGQTLQYKEGSFLCGEAKFLDQVLWFFKSVFFLFSQVWACKFVVDFE